MSPEVRRPRGFATAAIVILLVMLAVFGTALTVLSTTQHGGFALDVQGARAYHATRGGLEWGMYQVLRTGGLGCAAINGASFAYAGNLADFRVTIGCAESAHEEVATTVTMYALTATACNDAVCPTASAPPPGFYVERQLRVAVGSN
jgi:MSHA biogenesis protein MshP